MFGDEEFCRLLCKAPKTAPVPRWVGVGGQKLVKIEKAKHFVTLSGVLFCFFTLNLTKNAPGVAKPAVDPPAATAPARRLFTSPGARWSCCSGAGAYSSVWLCMLIHRESRAFLEVENGTCEVLSPKLVKIRTGMKTLNTQKSLPCQTCHGRAL